MSDVDQSRFACSFSSCFWLSPNRLFFILISFSSTSILFCFQIASISCSFFQAWTLISQSFASDRSCLDFSSCFAFFSRSSWSWSVNCCYLSVSSIRYESCVIYSSFYCTVFSMLSSLSYIFWLSSICCFSFCYVCSYYFQDMHTSSLSFVIDSLSSSISFYLDSFSFYDCSIYAYNVTISYSFWDSCSFNCCNSAWAAYI